MSTQSQKEPEQEFLPEIRRARLDRLTIYEVSESELVILERGSPDSIYLNVAIALLSMAVSLTVSLASKDVKRMGTFVVLVVLLVVGYVGGIVLLLLWWRSCRFVSGCSKAIRDRLPPKGTLATATINTP